MEKPTYKPYIGDVVNYNGHTVVVMNIKLYENASSCCYDRHYLLCNYDYLSQTLQQQAVIPFDDIRQHSIELHVTGVHFPVFTKVTNIAPFDVQSIECFKIRQKTATTHTTYI